MRNAPRTALLFIASAILLAGCTAAPPPADEPPVDPGLAADTSCVVDTWQLDLDDYQAQSETYLTGLGIPISDFLMLGSQELQITSDGLMALTTDITTNGTLTAGGQSIPITTSTVNSHSGDWIWQGDGTPLAISNWALVGDDLSAGEVAEGVELPAVDFTGVPEVDVQCSADELVLAVPGAPLTARFVRS